MERHGGWTLTLYRESSSFSSPLPKYGQCESEKVHVRASVREAKREGAKGETEKGDEIEKGKKKKTKGHFENEN